MPWGKAYATCVIFLLLVYTSLAVPSNAHSPRIRRHRRRLSSQRKRRTQLHRHDTSRKSEVSRDDDDTDFPIKSRSSSISRPDFEEELHQEGLIRQHGPSLLKHGNYNSLKNRTARHGEANIYNSTTPQQDALVSGFFRSVARFFGFGGNQSEPAVELVSVEEDAGDNVKGAGPREHSEDLQQDGANDEATTNLRDSQDTDHQTRKQSQNQVRSWEDVAGNDDFHRSMKEPPEGEDDLAQHTKKVEQSFEEPTKSKDADELFSESDLKDMVRLFRRLFSSLENVLQERAEAEGKRKISNRTPTLKSRGSFEVEKSKQEDEDEGLNDGEQFSYGRVSRDKTDRDLRDELPDVRVALAEAENLNRKRDAERHAKLIADSFEYSPEQPRKTMRFSSRAKVPTNMDEEEDAPTDEFDSEAPPVGLPKSAPSYSARKKLLATPQKEPELDGFFARARRSLREMF